MLLLRELWDAWEADMLEFCWCRAFGGGRMVIGVVAADDEE